MRTAAQAQASRINGAKSQGPKTEAGKARSSRNGLKLGLFSRSVVLATESQVHYNALVNQYRHEWNPQGQPETGALVEMVNARWRLRRVQTHLVNRENPAAPSLLRAEAAYSAAYRRALDRLVRLQTIRGSDCSAELAARQLKSEQTKRPQTFVGMLAAILGLDKGR